MPPPRLILKVVEKINADSAAFTLVVPEWPSAPFYPIFKCISFRRRIIETVTIPRRNVIKTGLGNNGIFGKEPLTFNMIAMKIR